MIRTPESSHRRTALAFAVAAALVFAVLAAFWRPGDDNAVTNSIDFRAFYCAGSAIDAGRDPFRVEPVRSCNHDALAVAGLHGDDKHILIAPLPPYALAAFALLARVPFRWAVVVWLDALVLAVAYAMLLVTNLTRSRPIAVVSALLLSLGYSSLIVGQIVPLAVAALALACVAARARDGRTLAVALAVAAAEPHVALPAWVGAFAFLPFARRPLAVAAVALVAVSFTIGPHLVVEYVTNVAPGHARSQLMLFGSQYGLSSLLWRLGAPIGLAMALGSLSYVVTTIAGTALGGMLVRRFDDAAFAIATPVALALIGGPFLHIQQIAAALPFALLLFGVAPFINAARVALLAAIVALAIPWQTFATLPAVREMLPNVPQRPPPILRTPRGDEMLEAYYTEYTDIVSQYDTRPLWLQYLFKLPTWYGLLALAALGAKAVRRP